MLYLSTFLSFLSLFDFLFFFLLRVDLKFKNSNDVDFNVQTLVDKQTTENKLATLTILKKFF